MSLSSSMRGNLAPCRVEADASLLVIEDLTVQYRVGSRLFRAIDHASFSIAPGEIVGLLGESGCGKTTLALALLQLLPNTAAITSGQIYFRGRNLVSLKERQLRELRGTQIALIFQDSSVLNPVMRVGTQVIEVLRAHSNFDLQKLHDKTKTIFDSVGLTDFDRIFHAYPHQLSGGQRQRIAIAQALICEPSLIIADEPAAHVDADNAAGILACLSKMRETRGTSCLLISHDAELLTCYADRIAVMYAGEVVEVSPAREIFSNALHPYTRALLQCSTGHRMSSSSAGPRRFAHIPGNSPDPLEELSGCCFAPRCADRMEVCNSRRPILIQRPDGRSVRCFKYEVE
jgi:peptide/nickel transport system ATP-binding protein